MQPPGQRGPVEHERRDQIIKAADQHFRLYGYNKTSVADLAKAIGVSSAYVYRFFESKQAIGEAVCGMVLGQIATALRDIAADRKPAAQRLRLVFKCLVDQGLELFFNERKLHDIVVVSVAGQWHSIQEYEEALLAVVKTIVTDGREAGEFERKTPFDEVTRAISEVLSPFAHPILLEQKSPEDLKENAIAVSNLVLRSLAP